MSSIAPTSSCCYSPPSPYQIYCKNERLLDKLRQALIEHSKPDKKVHLTVQLAYELAEQLQIIDQYLREPNEALLYWLIDQARHDATDSYVVRSDNLAQLLPLLIDFTPRILDIFDAVDAAEKLHISAEILNDLKSLVASGCAVLHNGAPMATLQGWISLEQEGFYSEEELSALRAWMPSQDSELAEVLCWLGNNCHRGTSFREAVQNSLEDIQARDPVPLDVVRAAGIADFDFSHKSNIQLPPNFDPQHVNSLTLPDGALKINAANLDILYKIQRSPCVLRIGKHLQRLLRGWDLLLNSKHITSEPREAILSMDSRELKIALRWLANCAIDGITPQEATVMDLTDEHKLHYKLRGTLLKMAPALQELHISLTGMVNLPIELEHLPDLQSLTLTHADKLANNDYNGSMLDLLITKGCCITVDNDEIATLILMLRYMHVPHLLTLDEKLQAQQWLQQNVQYQDLSYIIKASKSREVAARRKAQGSGVNSPCRPSSR